MTTPYQLRIQLIESDYTILRVRKVSESMFLIERFNNRKIFVPWTISDYRTHAEATQAIENLMKQSPGIYFNDAFIGDPETLKLFLPEKS